jgi:hypothetical protein
VGEAQLLACFDVAAFASKPSPVDETGTSQIEPQRSGLEPVDGVSIQRLGGCALAQQGTGSSLDGAPPGGPADGRAVRQAFSAGMAAALPVRAAASISSTVAQGENHSSCGSSSASVAAAKASSYRASPLDSTADAHWVMVTPMPSPLDAKSLALASMRSRASCSPPRNAATVTAALAGGAAVGRVGHRFDALDK